jgi:1,4-dihydroxy-2-naphthoate octaprenyltransferase
MMQGLSLGEIIAMVVVGIVVIAGIIYFRRME